MISFFSLILCTVLGVLLILADPAFAECSGNQLEANKAYTVDRTQKTNPQEDACYGQTAYVKFTFENFDTGPNIEEGEAINFEEIYPIQDGWQLRFNTPPIKDGGKGCFEDLGLYDNENNTCNLQPQDGKKLNLLSGFKEENEAKNDQSGHFVVEKEYYAAKPKEMVVKPKEMDECLGANHSDEQYCYEKLGSLTAIGGSNFPALGGASIGRIVIEPNAIRAPHWHLHFAEVGYCEQGLGQVGVIVPGHTIPKPDGTGFVEEKIVEEIFIKPNEVFLFPQASQHYLRNIGKEPFACTLFFAQNTSLNVDQLLTISLQNILADTPLGVLGPVFVTDEENPNVQKTYTAKNISDSPAQAFSSEDQGPDVIKVVEACRGSKPDADKPGCSPSQEEIEKSDFLDFSIYSPLLP
ncbi:MAG: cupin domain-containing protein [Symploca sp. SIO1A3]|nr:cupin domain-containing protein [Symploca sp. SIO1A3]